MRQPNTARGVLAGVLGIGLLGCSASIPVEARPGPVRLWLEGLARRAEGSSARASRRTVTFEDILVGVPPEAAPYVRDVKRVALLCLAHRVARDRWPGSEAELREFAEHTGTPLDLGRFERVEFRPRERDDVLTVALLVVPGSGSVGRVDVNLNLHAPEGEELERARELLRRATGEE